MPVTTVNPPPEGLGTTPRFKDWDGVILWYKIPKWSSGTLVQWDTDQDPNPISNQIPSRT